MHDKIRPFARHLESEGYGFISLPNGVKLRNTHTGARIQVQITALNH